MEADFSGWATKAGLVCSDGRTIMPDAFKHQDKIRVPLVWQHGHKNVENVLGHAILENRPEGVWCDAYFNDTEQALHAKKLVLHGDINMLSIWANELIEKSKKVLHGAIREVSLVLSGANPGALIDPVSIRHSDGEEETLDDEAIIYTGLTFKLEHSSVGSDDDKKEEGNLKVKDLANLTEAQRKTLKGMFDSIAHADGDELTIEDVLDSMTDIQKDVLHFMVAEALKASDDEDEDEEKDSIKQDNVDDDKKDDSDDKNDDDTDPKGNEMKHNVFEAKDADGNTITNVLSHADVEGIVADATKIGSLKEAVEKYALSHGIEDIDILFPEARTVGGDTPELFSRRTEWVADLMGKVKKSPFSRIKTFSADLTLAEARAKGYVKGTLKKEEFFKVSRRITTPTTIYKKQKLDRDDIVDITDFDVVIWLKAEMRLMLDEEIARAVLLGDGRQADDEDKVDEERIRPIVSDHEMYTTTITVNISDAQSTIQEALDHIVLNRQFLRGTGLPTLYTTETYIARFLLLKDNTGRKIYRSLDEVATDLRVAAIVPVEVLSEYPDILGVLVNPTDYTVGADKGGNISFFDDFDIDYNQFKYLIETRMSGALTKLKSAMVVRTTDAGNELVAPAAPTFDGSDITIVDTAGVVYRRADTEAVVTSAATVPVAPGDSLTITAEPAAGYYFATSNDDEWTFTGV